ncbi:hypothetical protein L7F22_000079 [Adiantum nelumboides]|nr:hypothetical protein [Adiantum nelumboides]
MSRCSTQRSAAAVTSPSPVHRAPAHRQDRVAVGDGDGRGHRSRPGDGARVVVEAGGDVGDPPAPAGAGPAQHPGRGVRRGQRDRVHRARQALAGGLEQRLLAGPGDQEPGAVGRARGELGGGEGVPDEAVEAGQRAVRLDVDADRAGPDRDADQRAGVGQREPGVVAAPGQARLAVRLPAATGPVQDERGGVGVEPLGEHEPGQGVRGEVAGAVLGPAQCEEPLAFMGVQQRDEVGAVAGIGRGGPPDGDGHGVQPSTSLPRRAAPPGAITDRARGGSPADVPGARSVIVPVPSAAASGGEVRPDVGRAGLRRRPRRARCRRAARGAGPAAPRRATLGAVGGRGRPGGTGVGGGDRGVAGRGHTTSSEHRVGLGPGAEGR